MPPPKDGNPWSELSGEGLGLGVRVAGKFGYPPGPARKERGRLTRCGNRTPDPSRSSNIGCVIVDRVDRPATSTAPLDTGRDKPPGDAA
eukprot:CAMPEP_0182859258 /NCGR_PEP_ID=MMETSP0034_2-20130328/4186_1 /TAXON_ID=156128 /ORGANISM="Nephroselmis pyriformis, Strain CCMP717" /LENGTH=88 /DNA_ID=CAMNT_0024990829 /DNA_START=32 /DNA_END=295 /DNA_ORIENTATION=-